MTDLETWIHDFGDRLYRFVVYRRMFTPYEWDKKYSDESQFEDTHYTKAYIEEAIELPDGDVLLGFRRAEWDLGGIEYYKLSEIRLEYFPCDEEECEYDEED